jgi:hypothetical protein
MKLQEEFVPLNALINSLGNHRRIYFLYKQAADSGTRGADLRFQFYKKTLSDSQLNEVEALFKVGRRTTTSI